MLLFEVPLVLWGSVSQLVTEPQFVRKNNLQLWRLGLGLVFKCNFTVNSGELGGASQSCHSVVDTSSVTSAHRSWFGEPMNTREELIPSCDPRLQRPSTLALSHSSMSPYALVCVDGIACWNQDVIRFIIQL